MGQALQSKTTRISGLAKAGAIHLLWEAMAGSPPDLEYTADGEPLYPAGPILKKAGISRQQLYQYTALGLIGGVTFNKNGYRLYPKTVFRHLKLIRNLNRLGYSLRDIKELFSERLVSAR